MVQYVYLYFVKVYVSSLEQFLLDIPLQLVNCYTSFSLKDSVLEYGVSLRLVLNTVRIFTLIPFLPDSKFYLTMVTNGSYLGMMINSLCILASLVRARFSPSISLCPVNSLFSHKDRKIILHHPSCQPKRIHHCLLR